MSEPMQPGPIALAAVCTCIGILTASLIAMKLSSCPDWAWLAVLSPLWISAGLFIAMVVIAYVMVMVVALLEMIEQRRRG